MERPLTLVPRGLYQADGARFGDPLYRAVMNLPFVPGERIEGQDESASETVAVKVWMVVRAGAEPEHLWFKAPVAEVFDEFRQRIENGFVVEEDVYTRAIAPLISWHVSQHYIRAVVIVNRVYITGITDEFRADPSAFREFAQDRMFSETGQLPALGMETYTFPLRHPRRPDEEAKTLGTFIGYSLFESPEDLAAVLLQVVQGLWGLATARTMHNDLHFDNVLIVPAWEFHAKRGLALGGADGAALPWTYDEGSGTIRWAYEGWVLADGERVIPVPVASRWVALIFDFDRGSVDSTENTFVNGWCGSLGTCSNFRNRFDLFTFVACAVEEMSGRRKVGAFGDGSAVDDLIRDLENLAWFGRNDNYVLGKGRGHLFCASKDFAEDMLNRDCWGDFVNESTGNSYSVRNSDHRRPCVCNVHAALDEPGHEAVASHETVARVLWAYTREGRASIAAGDAPFAWNPFGWFPSAAPHTEGETFSALYAAARERSLVPGVPGARDGA